MKLTFASAICLGLLAAAPVKAQTGTVDLTDDPAREIAAQAAGIPRGQQLPVNDARVVRARDWLKQAAAATGESEEQVAAASVKLSRYLFDAMGVRATPMETLEALARFAPAGKPIGDTTNAYFQARRNASGKSHAEAMATMAGKK